MIPYSPLSPELSNPPASSLGRRDIRLQLTCALPQRLRSLLQDVRQTCQGKTACSNSFLHTFLILLNIKAAQQHYGLLTEYSSEHAQGRINAWTRVACRFSTIKLPQDDDDDKEKRNLRGLVGTASPRNGHIPGRYLLRMNIHDTARTAKLLVRTAIVHSSNAVLSQCRGAHDARLDRDV